MLGIRHHVSISILEVLHISETGLTGDGVTLLSSLTKLSVLYFGGLLVTDKALNALQALTKIDYLDLWGSNISNKGAAVLQMFPELKFLNLAWTNVTRLPNLPSLECLNLSNCVIDSVLEGDRDKAPLAKLVLVGATFSNKAEAFLYIDARHLSFLDVSNSSLHGFFFLDLMTALEHLDLRTSMMADDLLEVVVHIGTNLRNLNLSKTKVTSTGIGILAGHLPKLDYLSLSHTSIDDLAIPCICMMSLLKLVALSNTNIRGFIHHIDAEPHLIPSLTALHSLISLESLSLEHTKIRDTSLDPLSSFQKLSHFSLKSASLTDISLYCLSTLSNLTNLGIRDAVLTNHGLDSFRHPATLKMLDLRGCWLLTKDDIL